MICRHNPSSFPRPEVSNAARTVQFGVRYRIGPEAKAEAQVRTEPSRTNLRAFRLRELAVWLSPGFACLVRRSADGCAPSVDSRFLPSSGAGPGWRRLSDIRRGGRASGAWCGFTGSVDNRLRRLAPGGVPVSSEHGHPVPR